MLIEDFKSAFGTHIEKGDLNSASNSLMRELGRILVKSKEDFVHLLNESDIETSPNMSDAELIELYVNNIGTNKSLNLGSALLVASHNKTMGFDGDDEIDDDLVKTGYNVISSHFSDEDYSNGAGAIWAGAIQGVAGLGSTIAEGQQKKKYGITDMASKQAEAKSQIVQQVLANKQAKIEAAKKEKEAKAKTTKTILIVGGVVVGLAILGFVIYKVKKGKK